MTCVPMDAKALYQLKKSAVDAVLKKHGVKRLVAFGSRDLVHIQDELEQAFGLPVNVLSSGGLRNRLKRHVEEEGVALYE